MQPIRSIMVSVLLFGILAFLGCSEVSSPSDSPVVPAPSAAFTSLPASPTVNQYIQFSDASTGYPSAWSWDFGDGKTSSEQNPSHVFATAGTFKITLTAINALGSGTASQDVLVSPLGSFNGNIVLGSPTATSIKANVFSPDQAGTVYIAYGKVQGAYDNRTTDAVLAAGEPLELVLEGLTGDTRYYYRLYFQTSGGTGSGPTEEYTFHTARPAGSTFTFCIQSDSHTEREDEFNRDLYTRTLLTAAADKPDFYLTLGDDFGIDNLATPTVNHAQVIERYAIQRPFLGLIGHSAPVFLVNGNHEQAARYLLNGTPNNVAVWAQNARNTHYSQPAPDGFYSGNSEEVRFIGLLRNYYAWTWGDALFVVIDPYWASTVYVDNPFGSTKVLRTHLWNVTHGNTQYEWLKTTLEQSQAKYKFVFAHHVMGTGRGGIELARFWEWGGKNANGTWGFTTNRPGWASPIHQLMAANHVTIFFQGHDHIWVRQQLDGVIYQTIPQPADPAYALNNDNVYLSGDKLPNTGYARVTVSSSAVKVDYIRTYLPGDEGPGKISGVSAFSYSVP